MRALFAAIVLIGLQLCGPPCADASNAPVGIHAYVQDRCIVADEPFYYPQAASQADGQAGTDGVHAKFLPLIGLVAGKLAELFINHEIEASAARVKATGARKDTRYTQTRTMNLYRADLPGLPPPSSTPSLVA